MIIESFFNVLKEIFLECKVDGRILFGINSAIKILSQYNERVY